jgi:hypothetical protein
LVSKESFSSQELERFQAVESLRKNWFSQPGRGAAERAATQSVGPNRRQRGGREFELVFGFHSMRGCCAGINFVPLLESRRQPEAENTNSPNWRAATGSCLHPSFLRVHTNPIL